MIKFGSKPEKPKRQKPKAPAEKPAKAEKFDRTAYQREYMRKWRARKKEAE
jgi:hypothetical protein